MLKLNKLFDAYEARKAIEHEVSSADKREASDRRTAAITFLRETIVPALRKTAKDINTRAKGASLHASVNNVTDLHAAFTLLDSHLTFEIETDSSTVIKWTITDNSMSQANRHVERAPIHSGAAKHFSIDAEIVAFVETVLAAN